MQRTSDIDLLLIGKTGNGKSALGNTILKRRVFKSKFSVTSVTTEVDYEVSDYKGKIIKVVDGPGVGDTRFDTVEAKTLVMNAMQQAIALNPRGYHAFLLVVRFGDRFTQEEIDAIQFLKSVFGNDFVHRFCILVMTFGDTFERMREENENPSYTFSQWCTEQSGVFKIFLEECAGRILLFDNVTKDESKRDDQINGLLQMIANLQNEGHRYTNEYFDQALALREKAMIEAKKPAIREESLQETSLILQQLEQIRTNFQGEEQLSSLKSLLTRCDALVKSVLDQDKGTGALQELVESVRAARQSVYEAICVHSTVAEERKVMEGRVREMNKEINSHKQQMERLKELRNKDNEEKRKALEDMKKRHQEQEEKMRKEFDGKDQEWQAKFEAEKRNRQAQLEELLAKQREEGEQKQRALDEMERNQERMEEKLKYEALVNEQKCRAMLEEEQLKFAQKERELSEQYWRQKQEDERRRKDDSDDDNGCTIL